jgi:hypothetical protein
MRNPLKAMIRRWLIRRLPADLGAGDICIVMASGGGGYKVATVLVVEPSAVHVRLFKDRFSRIPRQVNIASSSMGTIHDPDFGVGHLPLFAWRLRVLGAGSNSARIRHGS